METFGFASTGWLPFIMDRVWHLLLPSLLGATGGIAILSRYVRGQMLEVEGGTKASNNRCRQKGLQMPSKVLNRVVMIPARAAVA